MQDSYIFVLPNKTIHFMSLPSDRPQLLADIEEKLFWDQRGIHNYKPFFFTIGFNGYHQQVDSGNIVPGTVYMKFVRPHHQMRADTKSYVLVHTGISCSSCNIKPIIGSRYSCTQCPDFNLCEICELNREHSDHIMVRNGGLQEMCGGCRQPVSVYGVRYKCNICPDFYLCLVCEMQHVHDDHPVTRSAIPRQTIVKRDPIDTETAVNDAISNENQLFS